MPTYEYACQNCGHELEVFQRMSEDPLRDCPQCEQASLKRKIGLGAGIIFKGGGFYETDFKDRKGSPPGDKAEASTASKGEGDKKGAADKSTKTPAGDSSASGGSGSKVAEPASA
jgi:putative FmdB family regulatory protein